MVGLTYIDRLTLTRAQWGVILAGPLLVWMRPGWALLVKIAALCVFWGIQIGTDSRLLWQEIPTLSRYTFRQSVSECGQRDYLCHQNPLISFMLSRLPSFVVWQACCWLCAVRVPVTPLSLIMMTQPGHDLISYLLIPTSCGSSHTMIIFNMLLYGAACSIKSTTLVLLPLMVYHFGGWVIVSLFVVAGYWAVLARHYIGRHQLRFLGYVTHITALSRGDMRGHAKEITYRYQTGNVLFSLCVYLFPTYINFSPGQFVIAGILFLLAPNAKYFLLLLPWNKI